MKDSFKIHSKKPVSECISLLEGTTTKDTLFARISTPAGTIMCQLRGNNFRLWQKRSYGNSFKPFFYGKLEQVATGTEISGRFRMHSIAITFMAVWFGMLILMTVSILVHTIVSPHSARNSPPHGALAGPAIMMVLGIAMLKFCQWLGRSEKAQMTAYLQQTFTQDLRAVSVPPPPATAESKKPLIGVVLFFAGFALMSLLGAFTGISSIHTEASTNPAAHNGTVITHFSGASGRVLAATCGIFLAFMAYGTWKRLYITWFLGFVLIVLSAVNFVFDILSDPNAFPPFSGLARIGFGTVIVAAGLAVGGYWGFWWYKKREHFTE